MTRALLLLLALAACAPTSPPACSVMRWIEVPEQDIDRISDELAISLRAHNEHWLRTCEP